MTAMSPSTVTCLFLRVNFFFFFFFKLHGWERKRAGLCVRGLSGFMLLQGFLCCWLGWLKPVGRSWVLLVSLVQLARSPG